MNKDIPDATLDTILLDDIDTGVRFRKEFDKDTLAELVESIKSNGLISPIALLDKSGREDIEGVTSERPFLLLAGERRFRACTTLNMERIEAKIYKSKLSSWQIRQIELFENIHRDKLLWQDEIDLKEKIHDLYVKEFGEKVSKDPDDPGHSMSDTAMLLGVDRSSVSKDIALAKAMRAMPELANQKTKDDARKYLAKVKREMAMAELRKRHDAEC